MGQALNLIKKVIVYSYSHDGCWTIVQLFYSGHTFSCWLLLLLIGFMDENIDDYFPSC